VDRRGALKLIATMAGGALGNRVVQAALNDPTLRSAPAASILTASQQQIVGQLAELIIPRTDTPGAIDAGVPAFIDQIVSHWYTKRESQLFLDGLAQLDSDCVSRFQHSFLLASPAEQTAIVHLAESRAADYREPAGQGIFGVPDEESPFFYKLRLLTVLGFYTSELGATQELEYNPAPGSYDGDVDFDRLGKQWSS
jgi:hypothetical protein